MKFWHLLLGLFFLFPQIAIGDTLSADFSSPHLSPIFWIDGSTNLRMPARAISNWQLYFLDHSGKRHHHFMRMHSKRMHMIVVDESLNHFAHIHPKWDHSLREFALSINGQSDDFDNFMLPNAIPFPGRYFVFTETMPMPVDDNMPMLINRFTVWAESETSSLLPAKLAKQQEYNELYLTELGQPGEVGDFYKVVFDFELFQYCNIWMPKFYFTYYQRQDSNYIPIVDPESWMEMGGHAVLISEFGSEINEKVFLHLHAFLPMSEAGKYIFPYDNHLMGLPDGNYKIWGQIKHRQRVLTSSFSFTYQNPPSSLIQKNICAK